jgi:hypothetical protein
MSASTAIRPATLQKGAGRREVHQSADDKGRTMHCTCTSMGLGDAERSLSRNGHPMCPSRVSLMLPEKDVDVGGSGRSMPASLLHETGKHVLGDHMPRQGSVWCVVGIR